MGRLLTLLKGVGSAAPPAFAPDDISGLALWLDMSDAATLFQDSARTTPATADGDPVGGITDKSGAGRHHTQATASKRPTLRKAAQNSLDVIEFDGTDDALGTALGLAALTAATAFIVIKIDADPPGAGAQTGLWHYQGDGGSTAFPWVDGVIYDGFGTSAIKTTSNPSTSLTGWNIYRIVSKSGGWTSWLNGTQLHTTATNTVGWSITANTRLGSNSGESVFLDGRIAEFLVYDSELSSDNRTAVNGYLQTKWGTP